MTKQLLSLIALLLAYPNIGAQSFDFQYVGAEAGRPFSEVTTLMIDWRDYLWVGGADGRVCRFDGLVYTCWGEADGLTGGRVNDLVDGFIGQKWAATDKGIALWDGDKWTTPIAGRRAINHLAQLPSYMESNLIATRNLGLFVDFEDQLRALHPELIEQKITAVFQEGEKIVVASDEGVYQVGTSFEPYSLSGLPRSEVNGIAQYDENHLLLAIDRVGLVRLNERTGNLHILNADERLHKPVDLIADPVRSGFWLSTAGQGLIRLDESAEIIDRFRPPGRIMDVGGPLVLDQWGQLWMGGDEQLVKAEPSQLNRLGVADGLPNAPVHSMAKGGNDNLQYLAIGDQGLYQKNGSQWQRMDLEYGFDRSRITAICPGGNNSYWLGDSKGRLSIMAADSISRPIQLDHFTGPLEITEIIADGDSSAWVGTTKGLASVQPDTAGLFSVTYRLDLPEEQVSALLTGPDSALWIGQPNSNLVRIDANGKVTYYDRLDGLPSGAISSLGVDPFDRLWALSSAGPFWSDLTQDTLRWRPIPREFFDPTVEYFQLQPTREGLWVTTSRSLQLLRWNTDGSWGKREVFGPEQGWTVASGNTRPVATSDGRRYFANATGLTEYRPDFSQYTPSQLNVVVEEVSLFYEPLPEATLFAMDPLWHAAPRFQPSQNHFSFRFRAVDLKSPRGVYYRYRLTGVNEDQWSPETQSTSISYAGLKPGFYSFDVQARIGENIWSGWASCDFIILHPWWQRGFMPYLLGLLICTSAGGLLYAYVARIRKREEKRRSALELQNKLLTLEQQALQLQMNPHFIFNALGGIQSLIDANQDLAKARAELQEFARLMRGILHNSRQKKISLAEEMAVLEGYLRTASSLQTIPFDFDISVDPGINPEEVELPPMLIQPFVENAIIHGLAPLQAKGKIEVGFTREEDLLLCRVSDNGIGREAAARLRKAQQPGHRSVATEVNRQRLELMRGNEQYAPLIIRDGKDESGMPKGTEVILKIKNAFIW
ncbi:MAG: histidine kinase [Bacteroidota bacterium]